MIFILVAVAHPEVVILSVERHEEILESVDNPQAMNMEE
jgi:uncharacterized protein (DUF1778 family)